MRLRVPVEAATDQQSLELDLASVKPGAYEIELRITDAETGATAQSRTQLLIVEAEGG